jgi:decaprenylphospho-beta-D-erythro-pentofuranosid-2-ulose 2-reductase
LIKNTLLVLGARSDIGMAIAHRYAKAGYDIQLASRNADNLTVNKSDIELRYQVSVSLHEFNALEIETHVKFVDTLQDLPTVAVCAVGYMGNQRESELDVIAAKLIMRSNYEGPASILGVLANKFEERNSGCLIGISSVAGERGRATNYTYGSGKAGFTAFLSGLRNRLAKTGVHVITVLPGFVSTKMTLGMDLPPNLTTSPPQLAEAIFKAEIKRKNIIYHGRVWFIIMVIIKSIPEHIFKNLKL